MPECRNAESPFTADIQHKREYNEIFQLARDIVQPSDEDGKRLSWLQLDKHVRFNRAREINDADACGMVLLHKGVDRIRYGRELDGILTLQEAHARDPTYTAIASLCIANVYTWQGKLTVAASHMDVAIRRLLNSDEDRVRMNEFYDIIPRYKPARCECGKRTLADCWDWNDECVNGK
jgi:hypothetical protein